MNKSSLKHRFRFPEAYVRTNCFDAIDAITHDSLTEPADEDVKGLIKICPDGKTKKCKQGNCFRRAGIKEWIRSGGTTNPSTNKPLSNAYIEMILRDIEAEKNYLTLLATAFYEQAKSLPENQIVSGGNKSKGVDILYTLLNIAVYTLYPKLNLRYPDFYYAINQMTEESPKLREAIEYSPKKFIAFLKKYAKPEGQDDALRSIMLQFLIILQ